MKPKKKKPVDKLFTVTERDWVVAQHKTVIRSSKPWLIGARVRGYFASPDTIWGVKVSPEKIRLAKKFWNRRKKAYVGATWPCIGGNPLNRNRSIGCVELTKLASAVAVVLLKDQSQFGLSEIARQTVNHTSNKDTATAMRGTSSEATCIYKFPTPYADIPLVKLGIQQLKESGLLESINIHKQIIPVSQVNSFDSIKRVADGYGFPEWGYHVLFDYDSDFDLYSSQQEYDDTFKIVADYIARKFPKEKFEVTDVRKRWIAYISDGSKSPENLAYDNIVVTPTGRDPITGRIRLRYYPDVNGVHLKSAGRDGPVLYLGPALTFLAHKKLPHGDVLNLTPIRFYVQTPAVFRENIALYRPDVAEKMPDVPEDELLYIASNWCQRLTMTGYMGGTYDLHNCAVSAWTLEQFIRNDLPSKIPLTFEDEFKLNIDARKREAARVRLAMIKGRKSA